MAKQNPKSDAAPAIDLQGFSASQNEALLDLLVLAMYQDGNLAKSEEKRLQQLLITMGFTTEYDRNRQLDASVTRIRRQSQGMAAVKSCASRLAANFPDTRQQERVFQLLSELTALDGSVSTEEGDLLTEVKTAFRMEA